MSCRRSSAFGSLIVLATISCATSSVSAQLFENLEAFGGRVDSGDAEVVSTWKGGREGPKSLVSADFDADGAPDLATANLDGTVTVFLNRDDGSFSETSNLHGPVGEDVSSSDTLRELVSADLDLDGHVDLAAAAPLLGSVRVWFGRGDGSFDAVESLAVQQYARNLEVIDLDADGRSELVVAGGADVLRVFRVTEARVFEHIPLAPGHNLFGSSWTRPVQALSSLQPAAGRPAMLLRSTPFFAAVSFYRLEAGSGLIPSGDLAVPCGAYDMEVGALTGPGDSDFEDLVLVTGFCQTVTVYAAASGPAPFLSTPHQVIEVDGTPRDAVIVDLDGDGWNDLAVALRDLDRVLTYRNDRGLLEPAREMPVGISPRALAAADFNSDGSADVAVANRISADISILSGFPGQAGFGSSDQFYLVDGEVSALHVADMNLDGRDDVVQLHRLSGEASVRLSGEGGRLGSPRYYPVGVLPSDQRVLDMNADGAPDILVANLGRSHPGSIAVLISDGLGGFRPVETSSIPEDVGGGLFAVDVADFDGDGLVDVVAGFFDCRVCFFRQHPDGSFTFENYFNFAFESRGLAVADFDQDGDTDVAGASATGAIVVLENTGDFFTTETPTRYDYDSSGPGKFGTDALRARDVNGDGDPDLVLASGDGVLVYQGGEGVFFELYSDGLPGTRFPASSLALGDLDGDGRDDLVASCHIFSCVTILTQDANGDLLPALSVEVPSGRFVGVGDLDGDGFQDIVGSGDTLWTAVSSRRGTTAPPPTLETERQILDHVVLNEILASNTALQISEDGNRKPDWLELFNGSSDTVDIGGWTIERVDVPDVPGQVYTLPPGTTMDTQGHLQLIFSNERRSPFHTGFKLPKRGTTLILRDAEGTSVDEVTYPAQESNVSFARYRDGLESAWTFNTFPSRLEPNGESEPIAPVARIEGVFGGDGSIEDLGTLSPPAAWQPIRFWASGRDDVGIFTMSILWEVVGDPSLNGRVILYDDGMHDDRGMTDGLFAGSLDGGGLPAGTELSLRVEVVDLSGNVLHLPDTTGLAEGEEVLDAYRMRIASEDVPLKISEVVGRNDSGMIDAQGGTPDWVEVRNCSDATVSLEGFALATRFPDASNWYHFPQGARLDPGGFVVIFCDGNIAQGPLHAPFDLEVGGDHLFLVDARQPAVPVIVDGVTYGEMLPDRSWARADCDGPWSSNLPTPGAENESLVRNGDVDQNGFLEVTDAVGVLNYLFQKGSLICPRASDVNGSGRTDLSDPIYLLAALFQGGRAPLPARVPCE